MPALEPLSSALLAYGPAPGVELFSYFLALLTWVLVALGALFLSPILALVRKLRRARAAPAGEPTDNPIQSPTASTLPEPTIEDPRHNG